MKLNPLIITAACGYTRPPGDERPETVESIADAVVEASRAGAAIAQIRAPHSIDPLTGRPITDLGTWVELINTVRQRCDIIIHAGVAAMPIDQRIELFKAARPDIASFLLGNHSIVTRGRELNSLRTRADALRLLQAHVEARVVPDFEIFHAGSARNLSYLLGQIDVPKPLTMTLFFGWEGGEWSPPTVEEYLHRLDVLPPDALYSITVAGAEQSLLHALAIGRGGHVRAGLGDYPYFNAGILAVSTAQWISRIKQIAEDLNRELATAQQAAAILSVARRRRNDA